MHQTSSNDLVESQSRDGVVLEPMSIGQLLDRGLRIFPGLIAVVFTAYSILAGIQVLSTLPVVTQEPLVRVVLFLILLPVQLFLFVTVMVLAAAHWQGKQIKLREAAREATLGLTLRLIFLILRIAIVSLLGYLLLIVPGIIYSFNRILAPYILVVENCTISAALEKSRYLMTRERWYKRSSPYMRVFAIILLVFILGFIAALIAQGTEYVLAEDLLSRRLVVVFQFASFLLQSFVQVLSYLLYTGFYFDLRARYEGSDLISEISNLEIDPS